MSLRSRIRRRREGIPADHYTRDYFLSDRCEGFREFREEGRLSHVKERLLERVDPRPGERILEIGCGRGEVLLACAERGSRAVGIDYAADAASLSRETCGRGATVLRADATALPLHTGEFDKVFLGDVLEHLTKHQARAMLAEAHRVLRPGGLLVIHTSPNVLFIRLVFPWVLLLTLLTGRLALFRTFVEQYRIIRELHVCEYSVGRLRRLFHQATFPTFRIEADPDILRGGRSRYTASLAAHPLVRRIAKIGSREPFVRLLSNDLWVSARRSL